MLQDLSFNQAVKSLKTAKLTLPTPTLAEAPLYANSTNRMMEKSKIKCYKYRKQGYI
jgi:hypothetical protein